MNKLKLEVNRYLNDDVISTSGHYSVAGMSDKSYLLFINLQSANDFCDATLLMDVGSDIDINQSFTYYDEQGNSLNVDLETVGWATPSNENTGKWFHYVGGTYILCNDESHHATY